MIVLRSVPSEGVKDLPMSQYMRNFLHGTIVLENATSAVLAYDGKELVGIFLYHYDPKYIELTAQGTYVERRYRRQGIGTAMWRRAHRGKQRGHTDVATVSRAGGLFVKRLSKVVGRVKHQEIR